VGEEAVTVYRAVECAAFGPVDQLRIVERESPVLGPGSVRLAVSRCGVNFVDGLFVEGRYQIKPSLPFVPGMEVVGRVIEVANDVEPGDGVTLGDRVFANVGLGGYASEAVAPASSVVPVAAMLTDGQAATFVQSYMTGWFALRERAGIVPGECAGQSILVLGAGSGVGLAAVDIASSMGLVVIAAASTASKRTLASEMGAFATIDTSDLDASGVKDAAKRLAASRSGARDIGGVDYLYDPIGGELGETCLRALGENGQYLVIGFVAGIPRLAANQVLLRNRRVTGVDWGAWAARHPDANRALLNEVVGAIDRGDLHPVEPTTYPLQDASRALRDLASRKVAGKVALMP
jgi:NADPH:quinone reductase